MPAPPRFGLLDLLLVLLILSVATAARVGWVCLGPAHVRVQDDRAEELRRLVRDLNEAGRYTPSAPGAEPGRESAFVAPGYPYLLAGLARLPGDGEATARWVQCGLGGLTAVLCYLLCGWAFPGRLTATLAGFLAALHPFGVVAAAELNDGVLAGFLLMACLYLGVRAGQDGGPLTSWLYGLALAGLALVRAALLPFAFVAALAFLWRCRSLPRGGFCALLTVLGFVAGLAPWSVRNTQILGDVVPVVDSTYWHLWTGNRPQPADLPAAPTPRERDRLLAQEVVDEVRTNPAGTLQRRLWAGLYFVFGEAWFRTGELSRAEAVPDPEAPTARALRNALPGLLAGSLLGLLLLGGLGWRWSFARRREALPAALAVVWVPLSYLLSHAAELSGPRLPLDGVLLCYAALAITCLLRGCRDR